MTSKNPEICCLTALADLGALTPDELSAIDAHLAAGCSRCDEEKKRCRGVDEALLLAPAPRKPPARLRARVLGLPGTGALHSAEGRIRFVASSSIAWQALADTAVETRLLARDPRRRSVTQLIRMKPGTSLPRHRHTDVEESYLLSGDLTVDGVAMLPGDYCRAEAQTEHRHVFTRRGCVFLAICSEHNEYFTEDGDFTL